jgi:hypothetical protein
LLPSLTQQPGKLVQSELGHTDGFQAGTFALYCNGEARRDILTLKINRVRVVRRADGYYAQFCLDVERREKVGYTGEAVGLDVGLMHFYTDSHGHKVECPQFLRRAERRLKREQRRLSRKLRTPSRLRDGEGPNPNPRTTTSRGSDWARCISKSNASVETGL